MSVWLKCRYNSKHPAGVVTEHHHHVRLVKVALYKSKQSAGVVTEHHNHVRVVKVSLHKSKK